MPAAQNKPVAVPYGELQRFRAAEIERAARIMRRAVRDDPEKTARQRRYDVTFYGLDITVDPDSQRVMGTVQIKAFITAGALDTVVLDCDNALTVDSVAGNAASFEQSAAHNQALLLLDRTYATGEEFNLSVSYSGAPRNVGFSSFSWGTLPGQTTPLIATLSEPHYARTWWLCKDLPEDKADSADIRITVPSGLTAVSNGLLAGKRDNGNGTDTFIWQERYPITTYLISLAISQYDYRVEYFHSSPADSMPVEYYITPQKSDNAFAPGTGLPQTIQMLTVFSGLFGPYPFVNEKYAQVEFFWGGGMEHQTATSLTVGASGVSVYLVAHELAHQWWGDMVTCRDWRHLWLNEGFATYSEALYLEALYGSQALQDYMNQIDRLQRTGQPFSGRVYRDNIADPYALFDITVYDKGAWVLHMLRNVAGDKLFFDMLKAYGADPGLQYGTAATEDFQDICESVYGDDLDWFFSEWIYGYGRPYYQYGWTSAQEADSFRVTVDITQTQPAPFTMPLEIFVHSAGGTDVFQVMNAGSRQEYAFNVADQPLDVTLDDGDKILKSVQRVSAVAAGARTPGGYALDQNYPNPFNRETVIRYRTAAAGRVRIALYTPAGRLVRTLVAEPESAGAHRAVWDGCNAFGVPVSSGVYLYRMTAGSFSRTKKMVVIR